MNVWTDGETMVVLGARGLSVHRPEGANRLLGEEQLGLSPLSPSRSAWRWTHRHMLAVTPDARRALFLNGDAQPVLADLDGSAPEILPLRIVEAVALDEDRFAAVHIARVKGRDVARLGIGALPVAKRAKWALELDPARPTRVDWPTVIWSDGSTPTWSRGRCSTSSSDLRLDVNRFGIALADSASGTIAIVRPGGRSFECVLRVPSPAEGRCWASCTERGLIVGLSIDGQEKEGAIVRFDKQGRAVVWVARNGLGPGHVTDAGELVYAMVGERELRFCDADSLSDRTSHPFGGEDATGDASISVANGGSAVALGLGHHVMKWANPQSEPAERVEQPRDKPISEPPLEAIAVSERPPPAMERVVGPAQLSLDPTQKTPEWSFQRDTPFEICLPVVNIGGAAEGLYVEVAGDAIDQGLLVPTAVEVAGREVAHATFDGARRVCLPGLAVSAGAVLPDAKKTRDRFAAAPADMFFTVSIRGAVKGGGRGLLTMRIGFDGAGTEGSLMRGRSIAVE